MGNNTSKHELPFEYTETQSLEQTGFGNFLEVSLARRQAKILAVSNEQFGEAKNLLKANSANTQDTQSEGTIDGWQVSRHLKEAVVHIRLCGSCHIKGVDIDTTGYANGAAALSISLDGLVLMDGKRTWINLIPRIGINENMHNFFVINNNDVIDTIRLTALPGGGISRCRVYGKVEPTPIFDGVDRNMACGSLGARVIEWNNGLDCASDILFDGDETEMSGWLTPRSRERPRNDTVIIKLAAISMINRVIIDTRPFSDKAPDAVSVDVCSLLQDDPIQGNNVVWYSVINQEKIIRNTKQTILCPHHLPVSHIRLTLLPDGGIQQIKVIGYAYCGSYSDILDESTIDIRSFWNTHYDSIGTLESKEKPVATIQTKIQQENIIQEEPLVSKDTATVENGANTAVESTADATNLNQQSSTIDVSIGEQINMTKAASDTTDAALTVVNTETSPVIQEPQINKDSTVNGIEEVGPSQISESSLETKETLISEEEQWIMPDSILPALAKAFFGRLPSPEMTSLSIEEDPVIEESPEKDNHQPMKEEIQSPSTQVNDPLILDSITEESLSDNNPLPSEKEIEILNPLDNSVVSDFNITEATDGLADLADDVSTENKQDEITTESKTPAKDAFILTDSLQNKSSILTKDDLHVKENLESKKKQVDGENMTLTAESDDTADQNPTPTKRDLDKDHTLPNTPIGISAIASTILKDGLRAGIPERKSNLSKKSSNKHQSNSAVLKDQHSHPNASFQRTTPYSYVSYGNGNTDSPPLIIKSEFCIPPPSRERTQKKDDAISTRPVTRLGTRTDALPPRKATQVGEPSTRTRHLARNTGSFKKVPTVLAECSSTDSSSSEEEESEMWTDRTFPKTLTIPRKRRRYI